MFKYLIMFFSLLITVNVYADELLKLNVHPGRLLQLNQDLKLPHQGELMGVPDSYSWKYLPRKKTLLRAKTFNAITGWGQVFWNKGASYSDQYIIQIRNFQFFIYIKDEDKWYRLQSGLIRGGQFRADFKNNISTPIPLIEEGENTVSTSFDIGTAFHFWPKMGRRSLKFKTLNGVLTFFEARVVRKDGMILSSRESEVFLIGAGADVWKSVGSEWDGFKTNADLGIGRIKFVGSNWTLYGFSNATDAELIKLTNTGFKDVKK